MQQSLSFMRFALIEARLAFLEDEVPVGAVIIQDGKIIAKAHNLVEKNKSALHHAEMLCLDEALKKTTSPFLENCDLYVTLEPCAMCAGAIALARIRRVYFGAYDPKGGFIDHLGKTFDHTLFKPEVYGGIFEKECAQILKDFFKTKR
ncbi:MAG: tRNA-specific adenosine deaminase [Holosporales bacterium]